MSERGDRFLVLFGLANAGGVIAYAPLLTLLLPVKVAALAGDARVEWLGAATLAGAIAASLSNIACGWASDVVGTRRSWVSAGLLLTILSYGLVHAAQSAAGIVAAIVFYQGALNMMLSPLTAWAADVVPDRRKGMLGGMLGLGPPIGALAGVAATLPILPQDWMRMTLVCVLVAAFVAPLLLLPTTLFPAPPAEQQPVGRKAAARSDFALLWAARLLVQISGAVLFGFLYYYFQSVSDPPSQAGVAQLTAGAVLLAFPIALLFGRVSDRLGPRKPFLAAAALAAAVGLCVMAARPNVLAASLGYALVACASAVFLALHSSYAMQLLPSPRRRGRDLGLLNLTNTFPAVIAPLLAIWFVPSHGFPTLLALLAALVISGMLCILLVRQDAPARGKWWSRGGSNP